MSTTALQNKKTVSIKAQALAGAGAAVCAVLLPQLFHVAGSLAGVGSALGEIFLPMHLPVLLIGLLAGPYAGVLAGVLSPLFSYLLTGMPNEAMLPFILLELALYGLCTGLFRQTKTPVILAVLTSQLIGRSVRAIAILVAVSLLGSPLSLSVIRTSITKGAIGIALQLILLPLIMYRVEHGNAAKDPAYKE